MPGASGWRNMDPRVRARIRAETLARDPECRLGLPGCTKVSTEVDHRVSRRVAGDGPTNTQGVCRSCNLRKGDPNKHSPNAKVAKWI